MGCNMMAMGFGFGFTVFPIIFSIGFITILVIFLVTAIKGLLEWNKNNHSPRLSVPAKVVSKRINVSRRHHHTGAGNHYHHHTYTHYYVTFQVDSGDRVEFVMGGDEYGLLCEGDSGMLSFQGTRYLGFDRNIV